MADELLTNPEPKDIKEYELEDTFEPESNETLMVNPNSALESHSIFSDVKVNTSLDEYERYTGNDINPLTQNIDKIRAQNQSGLEQLAKGIAQIPVELVGQSVQTLGLIGEFVNPNSALYGGNNGFNNAVVELGKSISEWNRDFLPIHQENPGEFDLGDPAWWGSNTPTVVSWLPLALGSGAITKGIQSIAKPMIMANRAKKAGTSLKLLESAKQTLKAAGKSTDEIVATQRFLSKQADQIFEKYAGAGTQALVSRQIEGMMEGTEGFLDDIDYYMEQGFSEEVARKKASEKAANIWKRGQWLMLQDFFQYSLLRGLGGVNNRPSTSALASKAKGVNPYRAITEMATEAGEEGFQYIMSAEADYIAKESLGLTKKRSLDKRLSSYMNGELATSMFWGAAGAFSMVGLGSMAGKFSKETQTGLDPQQNRENFDENFTPQENDPDSRGNSIKNLTKIETYKNTLENLTPNEGPYNRTVAEMMAHSAVENAKNGSEESSFAMMEEFLEDSPIEPEVREQMKDIYRETAKEFQTNKKYGTKGEIITLDRMKSKIHKLQSDQYKQEYNELFEELPQDVQSNDISKLTIERDALTKAFNDIKKTKDIVKNKKETAFSLDQLNSITRILNERLESINKQLTSKITENKKKETPDPVPSVSEVNKKNLTDKLSKTMLSDSFSQYYSEDADTILSQWENEQDDSEQTISIASDGVFTVKGDKVFEKGGDEVTNPIMKNKVYMYRDSKNNKGQSVAIKGNEVIPRSEYNKLDNPKGYGLYFVTDKGKVMNMSSDKTFHDVPEAEANSVRDILGETFSEIEEGDYSDYELVDRKPEDGDIVKRNDENDQDFYKLSIKEDRAVLTNQRTGEDIEIEKELAGLLKTYEPTKEVEDSDDNPPPENTDVKKESSQKKSLWTAAWKSANNSDFYKDNLKTEYVNEPDQRTKVATEYFERKEQLPEDFNFSVSVDLPLDNINDGNIDTVPIILNLVNGDNEPITINDVPVEVNLHEATDKALALVPEEFREREKELLTNKRKKIVKLLKEGKHVNIDILHKTPGVIDYNHSIKSNVKEIFGDNPPIAVKGQYGKFKAPAEFENEFIENGSTAHIGRVYTKTVDAAGLNSYVPLDTAFIGNNSDIIFEVIKEATQVRGNKSITPRLRNILKGSELFNNLLDSLESDGIMDVLNSVIYESNKSMSTDRTLWMDSKKKVLHVSDGETTREVPYEVLEEYKGEISDILSKHYFKAHVPFLGNKAYRDWLMDNKVLTAPFTQKDLHIQPTVVLGEEFVMEDIAPVENELSPDNVLNPDEVLDPDNKMSKKEKSEEEKTDSFKDALRKYRENDEHDDAPFQKRTFDANEKAVNRFASFLSVKTGWDYVTINNPSQNWAGKIESDTIIFNLAYANENTAFHEFAHPIIRQLKENSPLVYQSVVRDAQRYDEFKITQNSVKENYPEYNESQIMEETIVQMIGDLAGNNIKDSRLRNILRRLWTYLMNTFRSLVPHKSVGGFKADTKLSDIVNVMKDSSVLEVNKNPIVAFNRINGSRKAYEDWVDILLQSVLLRNGDIDISEVKSIDALNFEGPIMTTFAKFYDVAEKMKSETARNAILQVGDMLMTEEYRLNEDADIVKHIKEKIRKYSTFNVVEGAQDPFSEEVPEDERTTLSDQKSHYEINQKEKVSADVKFIMSYIPKRDQNGELILNENTGIPEFYSYDNIWNTLLNALADLPEVKIEGTYPDRFSQMMKELGQIEDFRPEIAELKGKLMTRASLDPQFKARFARSFNIVNQNYLTFKTLKGNFKVIENNRQGPEFQIMNEWQNNVILNFVKFDGEKNVFNVDQIKKVKELRGKLSQKKIGKVGSIPVSSMALFEQYMDALGITFTIEDLKFYAHKHRMSQRKAMNTVLTNSNIWMESLSEKYDGDVGNEITNETEWFVEDEGSTLMPLAKARGFFREDLANNSTLGADGKKLYNYASPSVFHKRLFEVQSNPEYLERLQADDFYNTSMIMKHIKSNKPIQLHNLISHASFYDKGTRPKNMNIGDRVAMNINMMLRGYVPLNARGSNSTEYVIKGLELFGDHTEKSGKRAYQITESGLQLSEQVTDLFADYIFDEIKRIRTVEKHLAKKDVELIDNYHTYNEKIDGIPGLKLHMFSDLQNPDNPAFNTIFKKGKKTETRGLNHVAKEGFDRQQFKTDPVIREEIKKIAKANAVRTHNEYKRLGIVDDTYGTVAIDKKKYNKLNEALKKEGVPQTRRNTALAYGFIDVVNSIMANREQQKIFSGDPALYGDQDNFQKRIISSFSDGYSINMEDILIDGELIDSNYEYGSAVIKDIKIASKDIDLPGYGNMNIADAEAWITGEFASRLIKGYGLWRKEFEEVLDPDGTPKMKDVGEFINAMNSISVTYQPLKLVHSELRLPEGDMPARFIYNKQSVMPLIPSLTKGTQLDALRKKMENKHIAHVVTESGNKVGTTSATRIHDTDGNILDNFELNPHKQSLRFTILQQDLPKKGIGPILESSQGKHNIYVDLKDDVMYGKRNRDEMYYELNKVHSALSNKGLEDLRSRVETDGVFNPVKANSVLIDQMTRRTVDQQLIEALEQGYPVEAIVSHNRIIQENIASMINSSTIKIKHSTGMSAIQASGFGFKGEFTNLSDNQKDGIIYLKDDGSEGLTPPRLDEDGTFHPGSIFIPYHIYEKYPGLKENPQKYMELMQGVDFRIPNQALSNIGWFEVAGILPPQMGDTAIVYDEITVKTGSDFDIDKINIMMYNLYEDTPARVKFWDKKGTKKYLSQVYDDRYKRYITMGQSVGERTVEGAPSKEEFIKKYEGASPFEFNSKQAIENHKLNLYKDILTSKEGYVRMMESLDSDVVKEAFTKDSEASDSDRRRGYDPLTSIYQSYTREIFVDSNSGVGIVANHITDHPKSQNSDIFLVDGDGYGVNLGIGDTITIDGEEYTAVSKRDSKVNISGILKEFMNAVVDAEKDPWAARENINVNTLTTILGMARMGIDINYISDLVRDDMIRAYVGVKRNFSNTFTFSDKDALEQTLDEYNKRADTEFTMEEYNETKFDPNDTSPLGTLRRYIEFQKYGSNIAKGMVKFSVDGMGKSGFEALAMVKGKADVHLGNYQRKFEAFGEDSMEATSFKNSVKYFFENFAKNMILGSKGFMGVMPDVDDGYAISGPEGGLVSLFEQKMSFDASNPEALRSLYQSLYSYIVSDVIDANIENYISKENSLASKLGKLKETKENALLDALNPEFGNTFDFISFNNANSNSNDTINLYYDEWRRLYKDPETKDFAVDLAKYAYTASGFSYGVNSFYQFIPLDIIEEMGIREKIEQTIIESNKDSTLFSNAFDQIIRHNANNKNIVPKAHFKAFRFTGNGQLQLTSDKGKFEETPYYIAIDGEKEGKGKKPTHLYQLVNDKKKLYTKVQQLGYTDAGYTFVEYDTSVQQPDSIFNKLTQPNPKKNKSMTPKEYLDKMEEEGTPKYYEGDIVPAPNTVFVFGSNPEGRHGAGAAKIARTKFGAEYGKGNDMQGNSYAIRTKDLKPKDNKPTTDGFWTFYPDRVEGKFGEVYKKDPNSGMIKNGWNEKMPEEFIKHDIRSLYQKAERNPNKQFKVAYRNKANEKTLNGYTGSEMIQMFNSAAKSSDRLIPNNIIFSKEWYDTGEINYAPFGRSERAVESPMKENNPSDNVLDPNEVINPEGDMFTSSDKVQDKATDVIKKLTDTIGAKGMMDLMRKHKVDNTFELIEKFSNLPAEDIFVKLSKEANNC